MESKLSPASSKTQEAELTIGVLTRAILIGVAKENLKFRGWHRRNVLIIVHYAFLFHNLANKHAATKYVTKIERFRIYFTGHSVWTKLFTF